MTCEMTDKMEFAKEEPNIVDLGDSNMLSTHFIEDPSPSTRAVAFQVLRHLNHFCPSKEVCLHFHASTKYSVEHFRIVRTVSDDEMQFIVAWLDHPRVMMSLRSIELKGRSARQILQHLILHICYHPAAYPELAHLTYLLDYSKICPIEVTRMLQLSSTLRTVSGFDFTEEHALACIANPRCNITSINCGIIDKDALVHMISHKFPLKELHGVGNFSLIQQLPQLEKLVCGKWHLSDAARLSFFRPQAFDGSLRHLEIQVEDDYNKQFTDALTNSSLTDIAFVAESISSDSLRFKFQSVAFVPNLISFKVSLSQPNLRASDSFGSFLDSFTSRPSIVNNLRSLSINLELHHFLPSAFESLFSFLKQSRSLTCLHFRATNAPKAHLPLPAEDFVAALKQNEHCRIEELRVNHLDNPIKIIELITSGSQRFANLRELELGSFPVDFDCSWQSALVPLFHLLPSSVELLILHLATYYSPDFPEDVIKAHRRKRIQFFELMESHLEHHLLLDLASIVMQYCDMSFVNKNPSELFKFCLVSKSY